MAELLHKWFYNNIKYMNKYLVLLVMVGVITLAGCKKQEIVIPNRTIITEISGGDWVSEDGGITFSANIDMPEIDDFFNQNGGVLVYISFDGQTYEPVPQVYDGVSFLYITTPGEIVLQLQNYDGEGTVNPPAGTITVKIVLIDSV